MDELDDEVQQQLALDLAGGGNVSRDFHLREPLATLAAAGEFRADMACTWRRSKSALRRVADRLADLPLLAQMFAEEQNRQGTKQLAGLAPEGIDRLALYPWPGNVEELAEVIAVADKTAEGPRISAADLPAKIQYSLNAATRPRRAEETIVLEQFLSQIEEELIRQALLEPRETRPRRPACSA